MILKQHWTKQKQNADNGFLLYFLAELTIIYITLIIVISMLAKDMEPKWLLNNQENPCEIIEY